MRTILIIVLGLFIAQNLNAQNDSLIIKLGDYGHLIIVSSNLAKAEPKNLGISKSYRDFYNDFEKIDKSKLNDKSYQITYTKVWWADESKHSLAIKNIENEPDLYYFQEGKHQELLPGKYKINFDAQRRIELYLNSIDDFYKVTLLNLDSLYIQSLGHFQNQNLRKKDSYKVFYSSNENVIDKTSNFIFKRQTHDYIQIGASFGMTMLSSTFAPELNINLEFDLHNKGFIKNKFGIHSSYLFMPNKNDFFDINTYNFLNVSYSMNYYFLGYSENSKNTLSHKISIGYLIGRNGDDFGKNTWNAYWQTNINKIGIKLGGYFTKNTEGNYVTLPSIGFDFGF